MKKFISNKYLLFLYGTIFFIGVWWIVSILIDFNEMIVPNPIVTFGEAFRLLGIGYTWVSIGYSLLRLLIGFAISFVLAFVLAMLVYDNEKMYHFLTPTMTVLKAVPTAAVVFLFIVLAGSSNAPLYVVILICLPILYEAIASGLKNIDPFIIESTRVDGSKRLNTLFKVRLPIAMPYIIVGVVSSFSLSFKIEIMAEVITGSTKNGIGCLIRAAQVDDPTNMTGVFAYTTIAVVLMLLITLGAMIVKGKLSKNAPKK